MDTYLLISYPVKICESVRAGVFDDATTTFSVTVIAEEGKKELVSLIKKAGLKVLYLNPYTYDEDSLYSLVDSQGFFTLDSFIRSFDVVIFDDFVSSASPIQKEVYDTCREEKILSIFLDNDESLIDDGEEDKYIEDREPVAGDTGEDEEVEEEETPNPDRGNPWVF